MSWTICYSADARQDLMDIYEYIAYNFSAPDTASAQYTRIVKAIRSLEELPMRHRLCDIEVLRNQGVRLFPVDNYLILYIANTDTNTVNIARVIHSSRDIPKAFFSVE